MEFFHGDDSDSMMDPSTAGKYHPASGSQDPREYFLMVLHGQLMYVYEEWGKVVRKVADYARDYEEVPGMYIVSHVLHSPC